MAKPSDTNPIRAFGQFVARAARGTAPVAAALLAIIAVRAAPRCEAQATLLPLVLPSAIVFDGQGNLYFAETGNHAVRMMSAAGVVSTVAGDGVQGFAGDNGPAAAAQLDSPSGLAIDAAGNLYIADTHNQRIREVVVATGVITTVAGTGKAGYSGDGGAASAAQLDRPTAIAIDAHGNLYIADTGNHRVRRIAAGVITSMAGDGVEGFAGDGGAAAAASIDSPNGLAVDALGNLFIADTHNGRIRRVDAATQVITTVAGAGVLNGNMETFSGDGGAATAAGFALPRGLSLDATGNLYVADSANHRIRRISGGVISTVAGAGAETFAGDGAPAVAASLDSPQSVAVSPAGLLTLADTGNQRVRQLDALPAPGPDIHTIAGLGVMGGEALLMSGPSVVVYGSGALGATFSGVANETGTVTFIDSAGSAPVTIGNAALVSGAASFSLGSLGVGTHAIFATYAGDPSHGPAQSTTQAVTVTPLALAATSAPASMLYGAPLPLLSGTLSGVLAQDAGKVTVVFASGATLLSPVGTYAITATLGGSGAANYSVTNAPASLTVAKAPTLTTLSASGTAVGSGVPVTLTIQTASSTSGSPTGSVTIFDGTNSLGVIAISATGAGALTVSTLAQGMHSLSAMYAGDAYFFGSTLGASAITVGTAPDFSLASSGATSQNVAAGSAATFSFAVAMQGAAMASPIALAVQGTPPGATASLNPAYIPPGGVVTSFTLTVQTPLAEMRGPHGSPFAPLLAGLLLPGVGFARRLRRMGWKRLPVTVAGAVLCVACVTAMTGCGDRINASADSATAKSYMLTVTGTATSAAGTPLQHSANVTLTVL